MSSTSPTPSGKIATVSEGRGIPSRFTLYLPRAKIDFAKRELRDAQLFAGGWTCHHANGGWYSPQGNLCEEEVLVYEFLVPIDKAAALFTLLKAVAKALLLSGEQEVLVTHESVVSTTTFTLKG